MIIDFANPVISFGGYFTYLLSQPLTIQGYDGGHTAIPSAFATSTYSQNDNFCAGTDCLPSPNEFMQVSAISGISEVILNGDTAGGTIFSISPQHAVSTAAIRPTLGCAAHAAADIAMKIS